MHHHLWTLAVALTFVFASSCSSTSSQGTTTSSPTTEDPVQPEPDASSSPQDQQRAEPEAATCRPAVIYREGLAREGEACRESVARLEGLPAAHVACRADSECLIYQAAGGCMGVSINTAAQADIEPVAQSCGSAEDGLPCWEHDFADHHIRCEDGCCVIFEQ